MSLTVENLEHNMARLTIEASAEDFEKACQSAYQKQKGKISVPGFRKGKAPRKLIEKMYGAGVFYEDAANQLIPEVYRKETEEHKELDIVSRPAIDVVQIEAGKPFIFTAEVALKPPVELGKYKGVKCTKVDTSVSDDEVNSKIEEEMDRDCELMLNHAFLHGISFGVAAVAPVADTDVAQKVNYVKEEIFHVRVAEFLDDLGVFAAVKFGVFDVKHQAKDAQLNLERVAVAVGDFFIAKSNERLEIFRYAGRKCFGESVDGLVRPIEQFGAFGLVAQMQEAQNLNHAGDAQVLLVTVV